MNEISLSKMSQLKLYGMQRAFESLIQTRTYQQLTHDEYINMLVQAEWEDRENRRIERSLRTAHFRYHASVEEIDFVQHRNLDKNQFLRFADCSFIDRREVLIVVGPTGCGKSFLISALGHQGVLKGYKVLYFNCQKLFAMLKTAKADGSYPREITRIEKADLLILDDFGLQTFDAQTRMILLEIMEDRYDKKSTIIGSQLPVDKWYELIGEGTIADAILDRLCHGSHRIDLKGESMRKKSKKQGGSPSHNLNNQIA
jgi:DNA replication protein DnaC